MVATPLVIEQKPGARIGSGQSLIEDLPHADRAALLADLDAALVVRRRDLRLSPALRAIYRTESWTQRSRVIRFWLLWVTVFGVLTCALDYVMDPSLLWASIAARTVFIPIAYGSLTLLWLRPRDPWIEGMTLPITVSVMMVVAAFLGAVGGGAIYERYLAAGLFATSTAIVVFPMSRPWCLTGGLTVLVLFLAFLMNPAVEARLPVLTTIFFTFVVGCLVPARHSMNLVLEHAFVLSLRNRLQAEDLGVANARLARLADTDGLTGLANRRAVSAAIDAAAPDANLGIILLDVDHFKRFNDSAGHAAGDQCLIAIASVLRLALGDQGLAARYGGEEFIAIVPNASPERLLLAADGIRSGLAARGLPHPGLAPGAMVSVSVGLAVGVPSEAIGGAVGLIRDADLALYAAKNQGRDRAVAAWAMAVPPSPAPAATLPVQAA